MAPTLMSISLTRSTISASEAPVLPTRPTRFLTCSEEVLINDLMSSMTPMMLETDLEEFSISPIASIALPTTSPERSAPSFVSETSLPAPPYISRAYA